MNLFTWLDDDIIPGRFVIVNSARNLKVALSGQVLAQIQSGQLHFLQIETRLQRTGLRRFRQQFLDQQNGLLIQLFLDRLLFLRLVHSIDREFQYLNSKI